MFLLDDPQFVRNDEAVRLVALMAGLYKEEGETKRFVTTWIQEIDILPGKAARDRWDDLAEKLAKGYKLRACVQAAYEQNKDNPHVEFLKTLLQRKYDLAEDHEAAAFDPLEYLYLFDRSTERNLLQRGLRSLAKPPFPPIVIAVLAERADEHDLFVRDSSAGLLGRFLGNTGASQDGDMLEWSDFRVSAEDEIRDLADKKSVDGSRMEGDTPEQLDKVIARLGPALGGRTARLELSTNDLAQPAMRAKLKEFIGYWMSFAPQLQPPVLYVNMVRYCDADPSPVEIEPKLTELLAEAGRKPLTPLILSECEPKHFPPWRSKITAFGRKFHEQRYDQFTQLFTAAFRLHELKERLRQPEGRIYS